MLQANLDKNTKKVRIKKVDREKEYYSIGEVAKATSVATHTLRYWEKEGLLKSVRSGNSQRRYTRREIDAVQSIKDLLHVKKVTIKGAKKIMAQALASGFKPNTYHIELGNGEGGDEARKKLSSDIRAVMKETLSVMDSLIKKFEQ